MLAMKGYITTDAAASLLKVTVRRVQAMLNSGVLKGEKFGRAWLVNEASAKRVAATERKAGRPKKRKP